MPCRSSPCPPRLEKAAVAFPTQTAQNVWNSGISVMRWGWPAIAERAAARNCDRASGSRGRGPSSLERARCCANKAEQNATAVVGQIDHHRPRSTSPCEKDSSELVPVSPIEFDSARWCWSDFYAKTGSAGGANLDRRIVLKTNAQGRVGTYGISVEYPSATSPAIASARRSR